MRIFSRRQPHIDLRDRSNTLTAHGATSAPALPASGGHTMAERAVADRVMRWYGGAKTPVFGAPTRCPDCGNYGMVDRIDERHGRTENSCFSCGTSWTLARHALEQRPVTTVAEPLGGGVLVRDLFLGNALVPAS